MDNREAIVKILASFLRCEKCNKNIDAEAINLLGQKDDWWFFVVRCTDCGESRVVAAMAKEEDVSTPEEAQEGEKADEGPPITSDDVLDTHLSLRDFQGDFKALFTSE